MGADAVVPETEALRKELVSRIEHENELLNQRITWYLTSLPLSLGAAGWLAQQSKLPGEVLSVVLLLLTMMISLSFARALSIGRKAVRRYLDVWKHVNDPGTVIANDATQIGICGYLETDRCLCWLSPWNLLPWLGFVAAAAFLVAIATPVLRK